MTISEQMPQVTDERPCAVYRFYDRAGHLLYVGMSQNMPARIADHAAKKPWWGEVASWRVENYDGREAANAAEQGAIDTEKPRYNIVRAVGKTPMQSFRCDLALWRAAQAKARSRGTNLGAALRAHLREYAEDE